MPRHRSTRAPERDGAEAPAAKLATYTLDGETGRFALTVGAAGLTVCTPLEPVSTLSNNALEERLAKLDEPTATQARDFIDRQRAHVERAKSVLDRIVDPELRQIVIDGLAGQAAIGLSHHGSEEVKKEVRIKPREASKRSSVLTEIIIRRAREYRMKASKLVVSDLQTAENIWILVALDLDQLPEAPKRWKRYYGQRLAQQGKKAPLVKAFIATIAKALGSIQLKASFSSLG